MDNWNSTKFIDTVSQKTGTAPIASPLVGGGWRVNGGASKSICMLPGASTDIPAGRSVDWFPHQPMAVRRAALTPQRLKIVREYMRANLDRDIGLGNISASVGLSRFHFSRAFKRETGISPHRYFTNMRVQKAQDLLRRTALPIA